MIVRACITLQMIDYLLHILDFAIELGNHIVLFLDDMDQSLETLVFRVNIDADLFRWWQRLLGVFSVNGGAAGTLGDIEVLIKINLAVYGDFRGWSRFEFLWIGSHFMKFCSFDSRRLGPSNNLINTFIVELSWFLGLVKFRLCLRHTSHFLIKYLSRSFFLILRLFILLRSMRRGDFFRSCGVGI